MTFDGANDYLYDGAGRLCAVENLQSGPPYVMTGYLYDGNGNRIAKGSLTSFSCNLTSNGFAETSRYVVDKDGEQLTEFDGSTPVHTNVFAGGKLLATYSNSQVYFGFFDWLGTKRSEIASNCTSTYASLPYGDELTPSGNCPDATEHHYTDKEHDQESGNDFFLARYYTSTAGRFISPDWSGKAEAVPYATFDDPQSLNLYGYVNNDPLGKADVDGHLWICASCAVAAAKRFAAEHPRTMQAVKGTLQVAAGTAGVFVSGSAEIGTSGAATVGVLFGVQASTALATKGLVNIMGAATNEDVSAGTKGLGGVANPAATLTSAATGGNLEKGAEAGAIANAAVLGANASDIFTGTTAAKIIKAGDAAATGFEAAKAVHDITQQEQQRDKQQGQQGKIGNCSTQHSCQ